MANKFDPETGRPIADVPARPADVKAEDPPRKRSPDELLSNRLPEDRFKYIVPVFAALIGAVMIIAASFFAQALAYLVCAVFVISGILMVFGMSAPRQSRGRDREQRLNYAIYTGAWFIILGIASLAKAGIIIELIPVFFGSVLCLLGVVKLRLIPAMRRIWFPLAVSAYLSAAVGILVIVIPGGEIGTVKIIGIAFIVEALIDAGIFIAADIGRMKAQRPDSGDRPQTGKQNLVIKWVIRLVIAVALIVLTVLAFTHLTDIVSVFG